MSRKPCPVLQDLPSNVKQRIADNLERYTDKMALRSFSPDFRQIIGDPQAHLNDVNFSYQSLISTLEIRQNNSSQEFTFQSKKPGFNFKKNLQPRIEEVAQLTLREFHALFANPNLTMETFSIKAGDNHPIFSELIPEKLRVQKFRMSYTGSQEAILPVLSRLDSNVLKSLDLTVVDVFNSTPVKEFSEIDQLDQWKNIEQLKLCGILSGVIPVEHWWNVPRISLEMNSNLGQLRAMINHFRGCPTFQKCEITTSLGISVIKTAIGEDRLGIFMEIDLNILRYFSIGNDIAFSITIRDGRYIEISRGRLNDF